MFRGAADVYEIRDQPVCAALNATYQRAGEVSGGKGDAVPHGEIHGGE